MFHLLHVIRDYHSSVYAKGVKLTHICVPEYTDCSALHSHIFLKLHSVVSFSGLTSVCAYFCCPLELGSYLQYSKVQRYKPHRTENTVKYVETRQEQSPFTACP
jgi:hypothetical protein